MTIEIETFWCQGCGQVRPGWMVPDDRSVIGEFAAVIGLVDAAGQPTAVGAALVLDFYGRLLGAAPGLAERFPDDLLEANAKLDGRGAKQRDKLLRAVLAVATLFSPGDAERMGKLDEALESMGQAHIKHHAVIEEYAAVTTVLLGVFENYARTAQVPYNVWTEAYEPALRRALTYTSGRMMAAESVGAAPRTEPVTEVLEKPERVEKDGGDKRDA